MGDCLFSPSEWRRVRLRDVMGDVSDDRARCQEGGDEPCHCKPHTDRVAPLENHGQDVENSRSGGAEEDLRQPEETECAGSDWMVRRPPASFVEAGGDQLGFFGNGGDAHLGAAAGAGGEARFELLAVPLELPDREDDADEYSREQNYGGKSIIHPGVPFVMSI